VILHLTKKARDFLGLGPADLVAVAANDPPPLTAWYVNVLTVDRRKCLHVTEATTFYPVVIAGVRKADMADFGGLVRQHLRVTLGNDGFSRAEIAAAVTAGPDAFAKTASRQVLGVMNDQAAGVEAFVAGHGGLARTDMAQANTWLGTYIVGSLKETYPREAMRAAITTQLG
jgi:hypothetical protein